MKRIHKIGIGIAIAVVAFGIAVMTVGIWAEKKAQTFFYPMAPPMPAIVDEPMPEILARLELVLKTNAPQVLAALRPGISSNQISQLEQQYHVQVPDDIQDIYEWRDGATANTNYSADLPNTGSYADLIPGHHFLSLEEMLEDNKAVKNLANKVAHGPSTSVERVFYRLVEGHRNSWYCLLDDGEQDGYFFDPTRKPAEGAVFSTFTEDGSFLFFPSAKNLMAGIVRCYEKGAYRVKSGTSHLQLDEDFDQSQKIWTEFGAGNHTGE
ncbi:MAG TPA: SMI1/KNR4 family protein [Verrucomicrobiae bacterium]|jgi:cell wall assembly regulator SMI1|nr:SMI1/KNR4 family protein [Verrucomicrobiae bacterium]